MPAKAKTKEHIPTLIDNNLHNLVVILQATKAAIKSLEDKKDKLDEEIKAFANDVEGGKMTIRSTEFAATSTYTLNLTPIERNTISEKRLRERLQVRGIAPDVIRDVIAYASSQSNFTTLRVTENKQEKES